MTTENACQNLMPVGLLKNCCCGISCLIILESAPLPKEKYVCGVPHHFYLLHTHCSAKMGALLFGFCLLCYDRMSFQLTWSIRKQYPASKSGIQTVTFSHSFFFNRTKGMFFWHVACCFSKDLICIICVWHVSGVAALLKGLMGCLSVSGNKG